MQRDHRERLWDYRKRERCLTSFQVFQLPAVPALVSWLQLHGRPWARSTQARPSQISMPQRLWGGNKMIIIVLRHSVWGEICCIARDNLNTSISRNLTISPTLICATQYFFSYLSNKTYWLYLLLGVGHVKHLSCFFVETNMDLSYTSLI